MGYTERSLSQKKKKEEEEEKKKSKQQASGIAKCFPQMCHVLGSIPNTTK
jgi:hypothetical protein